MILYFRGPCHISITTMTHPTLDPRPKTASDWWCPWQPHEPQLILLSLSLRCPFLSPSLRRSILSGHSRAGLRKHVDLAHISLHRQGRHSESSAVRVRLQRRHTSRSQIHPSPPSATPLAFRSNPHPSPRPHLAPPVGGRYTDL